MPTKEDPLYGPVKSARKPILNKERGPKQPIPVPDPRMFSGLLGEIAEDVSEGIEADKTGIYGCLLSMAGMLVGRKPHVMIGNRRHPFLIYPVLIGRTGSGRKGDAMATANLLMDSASSFELDSLTVTGIGSGEGLVWHIRDPDDKGGTEDKRLLVYEEELGHIISISSRDGSILSGTIQKAWDGVALQSLTRNPYRASWSHIAIIAAITPDEFRARIGNKDLAKGLWNRYLPLFVERRQLIACPEGMTPEELEEYSNKIRKGLVHASGLDNIPLSARARRLFEDELYPEFSDLLDEDRKVADFLERGPSYLRRVSGLTSAIDGCKEVPVEKLESAACVVRYSLASARYALDEGKRNPRLDQLQRQADEACPDLLDREWIRGTLFHGNIKSEEIQEIIDTLCTDERYRDSRGRPLYEEREIPRRGGGRAKRKFGRPRVSSLRGLLGLLGMPSTWGNAES